MPTRLVNRINLDLLYLPFLEKVLSVAAACSARGADYYAIFGFRSYEEQKKLHSAYLVGKGGKAAPPGLSAHQYGLAVDFCRDSDLALVGLQPSWARADYAVLGEEAARAGLVWGESFGDRPHVQWPGFVSGGELVPLLAKWNQGTGTDLARLHAVWEYVEGATHPTTLTSTGKAHG